MTTFLDINQLSVHEHNFIFYVFSTYLLLICHYSKAFTNFVTQNRIIIIDESTYSEHK